MTETEEKSSILFNTLAPYIRDASMLKDIIDNTQAGIQDWFNRLAAAPYVPSGRFWRVLTNCWSVRRWYGELSLESSVEGVVAWSGVLRQIHGLQTGVDILPRLTQPIITQPLPQDVVEIQNTRRQFWYEKAESAKINKGFVLCRMVAHKSLEARRGIAGLAAAHDHIVHQIQKHLTNGEADRLEAVRKAICLPHPQDFEHGVDLEVAAEESWESDWPYRTAAWRLLNGYERI